MVGAVIYTVLGLVALCILVSGVFFVCCGIGWVTGKVFRLGGCPDRYDYAITGFVSGAFLFMLISIAYMLGEQLCRSL